MRRAVAIATVIAGLAAATSAHADAIDGDWCSADGRSLSIRGSHIQTPEGTFTNGDYARHEFAYLAPGGAKDAGQIVYMRLFDEEDMGLVHLKDGKPAGEVEAWRRCQPVS